MDERSFIERARSALEGHRSRPEAGVPVESLHVRPDETQMVERFIRELEAVGGKVRRVRSVEEARDAVRRILVGCGATSLVRANTSLEKALDLDSALEGLGVAVTPCDLRNGVSRERIRQAELVADVGLSAGDYGVAETGTLAVVTRPGQGRAVSLLPPVHVAMLRAGDIVSDLSVLFDRLGREHEELPSALTFITGPSRTADIELVLTVGVHGPKELHLVMLEAASESKSGGSG